MAVARKNMLGTGPLKHQGPPHPKASRRILVVDDDQDMRALLKSCLSVEGFSVTLASGLAEMKSILQKQTFDAILLDIFLDHENGLEALPTITHAHPLTKVILMTGNGSVDLAVEAMKKGASNFLVKSTDPMFIAAELKATIYSQYGIAALSDEPLPDNLGILGTSHSMRRVIDKINRLKQVDSTVLIFGESGTGKELVARALHRLSPRKDQPFRAINCGAIPKNLLESELFGHTKSAFTDAKSDRKGYFEVCKDGTLLLDEIGDLPLQLQVKLLRVLQEKEITPIGSSESIPVQTRVLASTNRDLEEEVRKGNFREDLFYRLSVLQIELPALRERKEDIPLLTSHFIQRFNERFKREVNVPSYEVMARLMSYHWPGNIRELQNAIERGVVLATGQELRLDDVFSRVEKTYSEGPTPPPAPSTDFGFGEAPLMRFSQAKRDFERKYLSRLFAVAKGNISEAARISGEYRTKLYRLIKRHHINTVEFKSSAKDRTQ